RSSLFSFTDTATTEIYTLSLHDALPISLVMGSFGTHAVNVSLFATMPYDPVRDFAPIVLMLEAEGLLVVHPSVPAQSVLDLIAYARAHPGRLTFASAGMGTASHLAGELFKTMARVDM